MLLCVLRELAEESKDLLDKRIRQGLDEYAGTKEVVRLRLREKDQDFFHNNIQAAGGIAKMLKNAPPGSTDSQQRILENAKLLHEKLRALGQGRRKRLTQFVFKGCYSVIVSTTDRNSAYRIFSVINARGLNLLPTDILKAEIVGEIATGQQQQYSDKWEDIEEGLGRDRFGTLFAHIRMIYVKDKQRQNLQDEFKKHVLKDISDTAGRQFIDDILGSYADAYERVLGRSKHATDDEKLRVFCQSLNRLDNADWIPPAIAFFHSNLDDLEQLTKFLKDLERLAYGLFILRANINERIYQYAKVLKAIEQGDAICREDGPLQLSPEEKAEIVSALNGPLYKPASPVIKPLLLRLDSLLSSAEASYNHRIISIEHVLPQNPPEDSQWRKWFPDSEEREQWTHRLANLVLLSHRKNSSASNWDFERKKEEYFKKRDVTTFALTTQVLGNKEWTPAILQARQNTLINRLKKEWRLN